MDDLLCVPLAEVFFLRRELTWERLDLAGGGVAAQAGARADARILEPQTVLGNYLVLGNRTAQVESS